MAATSVERALKVLFHIAERGSARVTDLAEEMEVNKATASRIASTLAEWNLLAQDDVTRSYRLGSAAVWLGVKYAERMDLRQTARPFIESLAQVTGETVGLNLLDGEEGVFIDKIESTRALRIQAHIGRRVPLHCGASSKAIMAFLPPDRIASIVSRPLRRFTENTVVDPETLQDHLALIRQRGYAVSHGEVDPGVLGVAAPIFDFREEVAAAVSVGGPEFRMKEGDFSAIVEQTREAASAISAAVGFRSPES